MHKTLSAHYQRDCEPALRGLILNPEFVFPHEVAGPSTRVLGYDTYSSVLDSVTHREQERTRFPWGPLSAREASNLRNCVGLQP